jgi:hypothetical protein
MEVDAKTKLIEPRSASEKERAHSPRSEPFSFWSPSVSVLLGCGFFAGREDFVVASDLDLHHRGAEGAETEEKGRVRIRLRSLPRAALLTTQAHPCRSSVA